jgi:hypothetical protein
MEAVMYGDDAMNLLSTMCRCSSAVSDAPRFEVNSDLFEVVATLHHGELSMLIDRYATNEPLWGAKVEVESGTLKALAKFNAEDGDYAIDDAGFLLPRTRRTLLRRMWDRTLGASLPEPDFRHAFRSVPRALACACAKSF